MTTVLEPLDERARECLKEIAEGTFLDGECYAFAIALHRKLGWPLIGLMREDMVRHAAVYSLDHQLHDVRGAHKQDDRAFGHPFGARPPYDLKRITEEDLLAIRPVHERTIEFAGKLAEILWPTLPWQVGSATAIRAFVDEIEAVSRKHGFWLRAPFPAGQPIISKAHGDEAGYTVRPTDDAMSYVIDRRLEGR